MVYESVSDIDVSSPVLTSKWEQRLKDIETRKLQYPEFMKDMRSEIIGLTEDVKRLREHINFALVSFKCPSYQKNNER
ncbi:MAG: hypothetical protein WD555_05965 [Fulvivirga sp.]